MIKLAGTSKKRKKTNILNKKYITRTAVLQK